MVKRVNYDEFGMLHENAEEFALAFEKPPSVRRVSVDVADGRSVSALIWQEGEPQLVLLHGGRQNAHTWDTVALAINRPLVAIDLPGHGHSDGIGALREGQLLAEGMAVDVAEVIRQLAPRSAVVVGMSLGGLTAISLADNAPELVRKVVLVDVLPGIKSGRAKHIRDFVNGPSHFESLDEMLKRTAKFNPTRTLSSLRRGILHNAEQQADGTWIWRWARHLPTGSTANESNESNEILFAQLWAPISSIVAPILLVRGMKPDSVLDEEDEAEFRKRLPSAKVTRVEQAGHSIQGDAPLELAQLIEKFVFGD
jgi:pimeloyl-ACP methyl ester carboxylesterase